MSELTGIGGSRVARTSIEKEAVSTDDPGAANASGMGAVAPDQLIEGEAPGLLFCDDFVTAYSMHAVVADRCMLGVPPEPHFAPMTDLFFDGLGPTMPSTHVVEWLPDVSSRGPDSTEVPSYNLCRKLFGLAPITSFEALTKDPDQLARLREKYGTSENGKDNVDAVPLSVGSRLECAWPAFQPWVED